MTPLVFLVAGEPSGDFLGARLMAALKAETAGAIRFAGVGGPLMEAEGLKSLVPLSELAVMGLVEVLRHLPLLRRHLRRIEAEARQAQPDVFVSIDAPAFSLRISKRLQGAGFPLVHYVAPSVWAWKPGRAKKIAGFLDHLMTLLPFEPPYFERHGLAATFVGHPAVETASQPSDTAGLRRSLGLSAEQPLLAVLPGSRLHEVQRLAPIFGETLGLLAPRLPGLAVLVPTVPNVVPAVRAATAAWPVPAHVLERAEDKFTALRACRAAIAASGTVGLELAVAGAPAVMAYKVSLLSAAVARLMIKVKWASIASLVLNRLVQPECLQQDCTPERLAAALWPLIEETPERARVIADGFEAARLLGQGDRPPSRRAAAVVLGVLGSGS